MNGSNSLRQALRVAVVGGALILSACAFAKTTGVGDDPALQTGPCYDALVDKNAANPTTARNRELGSACEAEHGDVDKAWARVIRLWGSDSTDIPGYDSYRHADVPADGAVPKWLAAPGILLTYAALGVPMRSAARLLGAYPGPARGAVIDVVASLVLRGLVLAAFIALFSLPILAALGAVALIALAVFRLGRAAPAPIESSANSLSAHLAEAINDPAGAAAGLAALALFVQHSLLAFALGLALALVVSAGPIDPSSGRRRRGGVSRRSGRGNDRCAAGLGLGRRTDRRESRRSAHIGGLGACGGTHARKTFRDTFRVMKAIV